MDEVDQSIAGPRVLFWHWGRRGGGPRYTLELLRALIEKSSLALFVSYSRQSELAQEFERLPIPRLVVDTYTDLRTAIYSTFRIRSAREKFWNYLEDQHIDVILCTMSHLWNFPVLWRHDRGNKRYVFVLHDAVPHPGDDVPMRRWLLRKEIACADGIVTLSRHVLQTVVDECAYPDARVWVIPHGVFKYAPTAERPTTRFRSDRFRLLFFGRVLAYKGLDILLQAYLILKEECPQVTLRIVGAGDLEPYRALLGQAVGVDVENRWIGESEIGDIFSDADLLVVPYREASQSGVIPTAYASGLPVVVTPVGGLIEQTQHLRTGLVAESASPEALAKAIKRMVTDPEIYSSCADGAAEEARERLSWPAIAARFEEVIRKVASLPPLRG